MTLDQQINSIKYEDFEEFTYGGDMFSVEAAAIRSVIELDKKLK